MRILFLNDSPLIKYGMAEGVGEIGHEARVLGLWRHPVEEQVPVLLREVQRFRPDAMFSEGFPGLSWEAVGPGRDRCGARPLGH